MSISELCGAGSPSAAGLPNYSVLMTVYSKVEPSFLKESIRCVLSQTVPTNNFVLVCDGRLPDGLEQVVKEVAEAHADCVDVLRLPTNKGTAIATQLGLERCLNDLVMKLDADDYCISNRAELQLKEFARDPNLAICGSYMGEFVDDPSNVVQIRKVPLNHDEIYEFSKRRNPFNNITVMYKRSDVLSVGGYGTLRRAQDYELYARMLHQGKRAINLETVLSSARLDENNLARRASLNNLKGFVKVRWMIYRAGHSTLKDFLVPCLGQIAYMALPKTMRGEVYRKLLRK